MSHTQNCRGAGARDRCASAVRSGRPASRSDTDGAGAVISPAAPTTSSALRLGPDDAGGDTAEITVSPPPSDDPENELVTARELAQIADRRRPWIEVSVA